MKIISNPLRISTILLSVLSHTTAAPAPHSRNSEPEKTCVAGDPACNQPLHTIISGDTMWELAQKCQVAVAAVQSMNADKVPTMLKIGDTLTLPCDPNTLPAMASSARVSSRPTSPLLSGPATVYSTRTPLSPSPLPASPSRLSPTPYESNSVPISSGTPDSSPVPAPSVAQGNTYKHSIVKGDGLWALAQKCKVSVDDIKKLNPGVVAEQLKIGAALNLPCDISTVPKSSQAPSAAGNPTPTATPTLAQRDTNTIVPVVAPGPVLTTNYDLNHPYLHTIVKGDTIWAFKEKCDSSVEMITNMNNGVDPKLLQIGNILKLPCNPTLQAIR
ncbi:hypothetical protein B0O99DRAFT_588560 [Bisporella sp. PMI_857]|nr:hypothetical protein B0O99DRAFT_588560 [Bisporella sp. PMI_857]